MPYRTCDLTHLAAHVRTLAPGPTAVVAVSGFPAAGKTTLAGLLAARLDHVPVVHVDDLTGGSGDMTPDLPAGLVAAHEAVLVARSGPVVLEGAHLLHPDLLHLADIHVWLDVDLNRANGNDLTRRAEERRRTGDPRPLGHFSFDPPPPGPVPPPQLFFDEHRPDLTADVLFVPVGRMVPPVTVRFFTDYSEEVLWDEGNELLGELEDLLPMSEDLRTRVKAWATKDYLLAGGSGPAWKVEARSVAAEGRGICAELQRELGPEWDVQYLGP